MRFWRQFSFFITFMPRVEWYKRLWYAGVTSDLIRKPTSNFCFLMALVSGVNSQALVFEWRNRSRFEIPMSWVYSFVGKFKDYGPRQGSGCNFCETLLAIWKHFVKQFKRFRIGPRQRVSFAAPRSGPERSSLEAASSPSRLYRGLGSSISATLPAFSPPVV